VENVIQLKTDETSNVIDMITREQITKPRYNAAEAEALIENLLIVELTTQEIGQPTPMIIDETITFIETNSGVSRFDVMNRIWEKQAR